MTRSGSVSANRGECHEGLVDLLSHRLHIRVRIKNRVNVSVVAGVCRHSSPVGTEINFVVGHYAENEPRELLWAHVEPVQSVNGASLASRNNNNAK